MLSIFTRIATKAQDKIFYSILDKARSFANAEYRYVEFEDIEYLYLKCSNKKEKAKDLILIHGFADRPESFLIHMSALKKKYNIILPYLPGFHEENFSEKTSYSLDFYTDYIKSIISHEKIEKINVIGHSLGGAISLKLYESCEELFETLTLIDPLSVVMKDVDCIVKKTHSGNNPFLVEDRESFDKFIKTIVNKKYVVPFFIKDWLFKFVTNKKDSFIKITDDLFSDFPTLQDTMFVLDPSKIKVPTHVIWGDKDRMFPVIQGQYIDQRIANSKLSIIKGSGHCPHFEKPRKLKKALNDFLI